MVTLATKKTKMCGKYETFQCIVQYLTYKLAAFLLETRNSSFVLRLERRITKGSSSGRVTRLVPVFMLDLRRVTSLEACNQQTMFTQAHPDG